MCAVIPVVGQETHETTFWALKVTFHQVETLGAESAVYDCLVIELLLLTATDLTLRRPVAGHQYAVSRALPILHVVVGNYPESRKI